MQKMIITLTLAAVIALTLVFTGCGTTINTSQQQAGIRVNGSGEIQVEPDIFNLSLGIVAQDDRLTTAQDMAARAMDKVLEAIKAEGVAEKDIQTSRFSVHQVSRWDREKEENVITGYEVSNMVNVKVREIDKAGAIIDATTAAGGDLTRINSMNFAIDDDSAYREQARELAIEEARAKAEQLAKLSRVKLGEATYVTETSFSPPIVYSGRLEMAAAAPPMDSKVTSIAPGELTVSVSVQIVYAIE